jgi:hypothetical protein
VLAISAAAAAACASPQPHVDPAPSPAAPVTTRAAGRNAPPAADDDSELDAAASTLDVPTPQEAERKDWHYAFSAFGWLPSVKGKVAIGNVQPRLDLSVRDFWDAFKETSDRAILGRLEARTDGWGLFGEIVQLKLSGEESETKVIGPFDPVPGLPRVIRGKKVRVDAEAEFDWTMIEFGASLDLTDDELAKKGARIEALGGGRYWSVDVDVDLNDTNLTPDDADWVDPFIGARTYWPLGEEWSVMVRADIGGGGFGTASRVAYRYTGYLRWQPWERTSLIVGWNHLDNDWSRGSGDSYKKWDIRLSGPVLGLIHEF